MKTIVIGALDAPLSEPFNFPFASSLYGDIKNPLIYVNLESKTLVFDFDEFDITWMNIASSRAFHVGEEAVLWMRYYDAGSSNPAFSMYASKSDAQGDNNPLASCALAASTPGLYPFNDTVDGVTIWGWIYTRVGIAAPGTPKVFSVKAASHFSIPAMRWQPGVTVRLPFQFYISGPTSASLVDFKLSLHHFSAQYTLGEFHFDTRIHQSEEGYVMGEVIVQCIGTLEEGSTKQFRSWMEVRPGVESLSQMINFQPEVDERQIAFTDESSSFLSLEESADDGGGSALTFKILAIRGEYTSTPEVLS